MQQLLLMLTIQYIKKPEHILLNPQWLNTFHYEEERTPVSFINETAHLYRDLARSGPGPRGAPPRGPPRMPPGPPRPMPGKSKVFSILDRARSAMDPYPGYDDPYAVPEPPVSI